MIEKIKITKCFNINNNKKIHKREIMIYDGGI
jgi:hypothetical protein